MDSRPDTYEHIQKVQRNMHTVIVAMLERLRDHDQSKLVTPEVEIFDEYTPKLAAVTYGSDEYKQFLKEMKAALDHHYANNSHHPEFHKEGIRGMTLLDLIEMVCDWKAASQRHTDGNIRKSIDVNQLRFGYSDELKQIFYNTVNKHF